MNKSIIFLAVLFTGWQAHAQSSADWSGSYGFPSVARQQSNMSQADLIAKREAGYYDNIGKTTVYSYNINTTSIGTMSEDTININGDNNTVTATGSNTGSLDASVGVHGISLNQSTYSADRLYGSQD